MLKKIRGQKLHDFGLGKEFLDMTPKAQGIKEKNDKLGFIKMETFWVYASKDSIKRMKRQTIDGEKCLQIIRRTCTHNT